MMKSPTKNYPICRIMPLQGQDQQGHESEKRELLSGVDQNAKQKKKKKITATKEKNHNRKDGDKKKKKQKDGRKELKESVKMKKDGKTKQKVGRNTMEDGEKKSREMDTKDVGKGQKGGEKKQRDDGKKQRDDGKKERASETVENSQKDYENKQKNSGKMLKDAGKKPRGVKRMQIGGEKKQLMKTITGPLKGRARKENICRWRKLIKTQQTFPHHRDKVKPKTGIAIETLDVVHKSLVRAVSERLQCASSFYTSFPPLETDLLDSGSSINFLTFPDVFITKRRNRPKPYVVPRDRVRLFNV